jgi:hypothetical protein
MRYQFFVASLLCFAMASLAGCGSEDAADTATPPVVEGPPTGQTWSVQTETGQWQEPKNIAGLVALVVGDYPVYLGSAGLTTTGIDFIMAIGAEGTQDFCSRTLPVSDVSLNEDRTFELGPMPFLLANGILTDEMEMTGTFSEDYTSITNTTMKGNIDLGTIPADMLPLPEDTTVCELLESAEIPCNACADGRQECLRLHVTGITANLAEGLTLIPVLEADCHEDCAVSQDNPECELP